MGTLEIVALIAVLLVGLLAGALARGWLLMPGERKRLQVFAAQLQAEARIDALTRTTIHDMRRAVHAPHRASPQ